MSTEMGGSSFTGGAFVAEDPDTDEKMFGIAGGVAFANGTSVNLAYGSRRQLQQGPRRLLREPVPLLGQLVGRDRLPLRRWQRCGLQATRSRSESAFSSPWARASTSTPGFHNFSVDSAAAGESIEDVNVFHVGSRSQFN